MKAGVGRNAAFLAGLAKDAGASGASAVKPVTPAKDDPAMPGTEEEKRNAARAEVKSLLHPAQ